MRLEVDPLDGDPRSAQHRFGDRLWFARKGDHAAVVIGVAVHVKQRNRGRLHGVDQRGNHFSAPPLAEIGHTFDQRHA